MKKSHIIYILLAFFAGVGVFAFIRERKKTKGTWSSATDKVQLSK